MSVRKPAVKKANHDATASTRATIYQLCVGLKKCFEMRKGQAVQIEELGDVTIADQEQLEVKLYQGQLSDGHPNFWKTLKNWVDDKYDSDPYASLILHTNQTIAEGALLAGWNDADLQRRLDILEEIHGAFKSRLAAEDKGPSAVYKLQEYVFDPKREQKLSSVVAKYAIEAGCLGMSELWSELLETKVIALEGKKEDYLNALLGFVFKPEMKAGEHWEVSYEGFYAKQAELTRTYGHGTREFPKKVINEAKQLGLGDLSGFEDELFIQKLKDIDYDGAVIDAMRDHQGAVGTILEEFKHYSVTPEKTQNYIDEVMRSFDAKYKTGARRCTDIIPDSQNFYDEVTDSRLPQFEGFETTGIPFRNGILHMQMDDSFQNLKWRLR